MAIRRCWIKEKNNSDLLIDNVDIGDYINIGINYRNVFKYHRYLNEYFQAIQTTNLNYSKTKGPIGWRVLSKDDGIIKLISAGVPLSFICKSKDKIPTSLNILDNLYQSLFNKEKQDNECYFNASGFEDENGNVTFDFRKLMDASEFIDVTKESHSFDIGTFEGEFEKLLYEIVGDTYYIKPKDGVAIYGGEVRKNWKKEWKPNRIDMLAIGMDYYNVSFDNSEQIFRKNQINEAIGIRPVIYLKSNLKVSKENIGDGSSFELAWKIDKWI